MAGASVIIVGGGPAGAMVAILLARRGLPVTLIEQHRFPRDKVCGECISPLGIDVINRHALGDRLRRRRPVLLTSTILYAPDGASVRIELPRPMWGLSRSALDEELFTAAREAGAQVLNPCRCEELIGGQRPRIVVRDLTDNSRRELDGSVVVVADGKAAWATPRPAATADLGLKAHFTGALPAGDAIELFGVRGHYGGLAPVESGRWNVSFSVPAAMVGRSRGDLDELFSRIIHENVALQRRLAGARRDGPWLAATLPRFAAMQRWPIGVVPAGNAAAALEPVGGEGIGLALRSAELAAAAIGAERGSFSPTASELLHGQYVRLWRRRRLACRAMALLLSRPSIAELGIPILAAHPEWAQSALRLMGKSPVEYV